MKFSLEGKPIILVEESDLNIIYNTCMNEGYIPLISKNTEMNESIGKQLNKKVVGLLFSVYYEEKYLA